MLMSEANYPVSLCPITPSIGYPLKSCQVHTSNTCYMLCIGDAEKGKHGLCHGSMEKTDTCTKAIIQHAQGSPKVIY